MISFIEVRRQLETAAPILAKFKDEGEFAITAGDFAAKIAPAMGVEKEAAALAAAIGADATLLRVCPRKSGSTVPRLHTPAVFANSTGPVIVNGDLSPLAAEFVKHRLGPNGYAVVAIGKVQITVPIAISDRLRSDLIVARDEGIEAIQFVETDGVPPVGVESPIGDGVIDTMMGLPQRDIPPHSEDVPRMVDLEVTAVLDRSVKYNSPRLSVRNTKDGSTIVGLIATQPIVRALTGQFEGEVTLSDDVVGQKFQIVAVEDRLRRDGQKVENEDGTVQKTVIVRNTTSDLSFSL